MSKRRPSIKGRGAEILLGLAPAPKPPAKLAGEGERPAGADFIPPGGEEYPPDDDWTAEGAPLADEATDEAWIFPKRQLTTETGPPPAVQGQVWFEPGPHAAEALPQVPDDWDDEVPPRAAQAEHVPSVIAFPSGAPREPEPLPDADDLPDVEAIPSDALRELHAGELARDEQAWETSAGRRARAAAPGAPIDSTPEGAGGPLVEGLVRPRPPAGGGTAVDSPAVARAAAGAAFDTGGRPALRSVEAVVTGALDPAYERALFEEARNGGPVISRTPEGIAGSRTGIRPLRSMPEAVTTSAEPAKNRTQEATMDNRYTSTAAQSPSTSPARGSVTRGAMPLYMTEAARAAAADIQEGTIVEPEEVNTVLTPEQQAAVLAQITDEELKKLDAEIDAMYKEVIEVVGDNPNITNECYNLLLKARDALWRRDAARIAQAEYYLLQAKARLKRAKDSDKESKKFQWPILMWGSLWCVGLIALLVLWGQGWFRQLVMPAADNDSLIDMRIFVPAMLWGGIGGATAVLYSLFKHVGARDFDKAYNLSYVGKPFLGAILGVAVYMAFTLLMRTLYVLPSTLTGTSGESPGAAPQVMYLFAWAGGFKENRVLGLVDRVMKQVFSGGEEETPEESLSS